MRQPSEESFLKWLRDLPCVVCHDNIESEACHVRRSDDRAAKQNAMGQKPKFWALPMCRLHHERQHQTGELTFWARQGIDPVFKALALFHAWTLGDRDRALAIIMRERGAEL